MFNIYLGKEGYDKTFQKKFPQTTKCVHCNGKSRLGFVAKEKLSKKKEKLLCELYLNKPESTGYWPHDLCAVAVYFCKKCLKPTALFNQN